MVYVPFFAHSAYAHICVLSMIRHTLNVNFLLRLMGMFTCSQYMEDGNVTFCIPLLEGKAEALDVLTSTPVEGRPSLKTASVMSRSPTLETCTTTRRCWPKLWVENVRALLGHFMDAMPPRSESVAKEPVAIIRPRKSWIATVTARVIFQPPPQGAASCLLCYRLSVAA